MTVEAIAVSNEIVIGFVVTCAEIFEPVSHCRSPLCEYFRSHLFQRRGTDMVECACQCFLWDDCHYNWTIFRTEHCQLQEFDDGDWLWFQV